MRTHEDSSHHAISSAIDHSRRRGVCFDQLQVVQDRLATQQTETKKLSEQITTLTERLDALQQSVASPAAASTRAATTGPQTKPR